MSMMKTTLVVKLSTAVLPVLLSNSRYANSDGSYTIHIMNVYTCTHTCTQNNETCSLYDSFCQTQYSSVAVLLSNSRHMQTLVRIHHT